MLGNILSQEQNVAYDSVTFEGDQHDTLLNFKIKQVFSNPNDFPIDISYFFPNERQFSIYDTKFVIDEKEIKLKLRNKEEAQREYNESIEKGYRTVLGEDLGKGLCNFHIGNLDPHQKCEVHLKVCFLADLDHKGIFYKFPLSTKYQSGPVTTPYNNKPYSFVFRTKVYTTRNMKEYKVSIKGKTKIVDSHNALFETNTCPEDDAIFVRANIADADKSIAVCNGKYTVVSTFATFSSKIETNSEFYFVVDCSGSMHGSPIDQARKTMKIFLKSLPEGCRFGIIKFGTFYNFLLETCDYSNENVKNALNLIDNIDANMGGTVLYDPLNFISNLQPKEGFIKQTFVLTDGEDFHVDNVLSIAQKYRSSNRIHSIGLGTGADPGLIKGLANISGGSYSLVSDSDNLTETVVSMLSSAIAPALTNVTIEANNIQEIYPSPLPSLFTNTVSHYIIKADQSENVLIAGFCCGESFDTVVPVSITPSEYENCLQFLFSHFVVEELENMYFLDHDDDIKKKCIELSISSNTLSKFTSYIGSDINSSSDISPNSRIDQILDKLCQTTQQLVDYSRNIGSEVSEVCEQCELEIEECAPVTPKKSNGFFSKLFGWWNKKSEENISIQEEHYKENIPISSQTEKEENHGLSDDFDLILQQNIDGSWDDFDNIDPHLLTKYDKKIAATIAAIVYINIHYKSRISEFSLILKKAFQFLKKQNKDENWESIVDSFVHKK